jgi:cell wall-associated NlpC family hydrolase
MRRCRLSTSSLPHDQKGSVSLAAVACIAMVMVLSLLTADMGFYFSARRQAEDAVDAAALAAVQESFPLFSTGVAPEAAARRYALANGATLQTLEIKRAGSYAFARAYVRPRSIILRRLGIVSDKVSAVAAAEVDVDALMASGSIWYTPDPAALARLKGLIAGDHAADLHSAATMVALLSLQHLGKPYVFGAEGPNSFDCSGLVCYVYAQIGVRLPRVTFSQVHCGQPVAVSQLVAGDLVFFRNNGHVGIYLGGGWFIHAPHTGDVVKISALSSRSDVSACRRIL